MLSQFPIRYPSGNLISELLQIHEGQFVVQVEVQVDGITRATGLAAAENLEEAEDRARSRALLVLGIGVDLSRGAEFEATLPLTGTRLNQTTVPIAPARANGAKSLPTSSGTQRDASTPISAESAGRSDRPPLNAVIPVHVTGDAFNESMGLGNGLLEESGEDSKVSLESEVLPGLYAQQSYQKIVFKPEQTEPVAAPAAKEALDMSDTLAQTSIELQRLGWSTQKGRNYLKKTYGKASRQQLTELEMFEFLAYLKSQPTPNPLPLES